MSDSGMMRVENFSSYIDASGKKRAVYSVAAMVGGHPEGSVAMYTEADGLRGRKMTDMEARGVLNKYLVRGLHNRNMMEPLRDGILELQMRHLCKNGAIDCYSRDMVEVDEEPVAVEVASVEDIPAELDLADLEDYVEEPKEEHGEEKSPKSKVRKTPRRSRKSKKSRK